MNVDEPVRSLPIRGSWAYTDRMAIAPGGRIHVHVSAEAAHRVDIVRLGREAVIGPAQDIAADRRDVEVLGSWSSDISSPQRLFPGSYVRMDGPALPAPPITLGLWLRLWRLPVIDILQIAWSGILTDIDYPAACRFGLLVDHVGRIAAYAGDGAAFRHEWLHQSRPVGSELLGRWVSLVATWTPDLVRVWLDGALVVDVAGPHPAPGPGDASRLRLGAMAEAGEADDFLDADVAQPFVVAGELSDEDVGRLHLDRGRSGLSLLPPAAILGGWTLAEEQGARVADASGHQRHGSIVNHGTWMVGGPAFNAADRAPLVYQPSLDPDRGHGLRLSSDDLIDAGWAVSGTYQVPEDAPSGFYAARIVQSGQPIDEAYSTPFVVSRRTPQRPGSIALLAATLTWCAYGRRPTNEAPIAGLSSSLYSTHTSGKPFFHVGTRLPMPYCDPYVFESRRSTRTRSTHILRPERMAEAWLAREGYAYEVISDLDLHEEPELLSRFAALLVCGHSEYWTDEMRSGVIRYLDAGGRVISMSGDTLSVRVTFDPEHQVMEARKVVFEPDPRHLDQRWWGERWHAADGLPGGSRRHLGKPSWEALGMNFKGMIDDGTPNAYRPYVVLQPDHPLLHEPEVVPISPAGTIGDRSLNGSGAASGYEFDANLDRVGMAAAPLDGIDTIASALGQRNLEWIGERDHGADLVWWRRPNGGEVLNFGSIAVSGALAVDPGIATLTRNVLARFGVSRSEVPA